MSDAARRYMNELMDDVVLPPVQGGSRIAGGSEDFAYVSAHVPTIALFLGAGDLNQGYIYPQHHPKAVFDDSVLYRGAAAYVYFAARWLQDNQ